MYPNGYSRIIQGIRLYFTVAFVGKIGESLFLKVLKFWM